MSAQFLYKKITGSILASLPSKAKTVLVRRFGLEGERETLQEIGTSYGITRERVRQIEEFGLRTLRAKKDIFVTHGSVFSNFADYFKDHGNLVREDIALEDLGQKSFAPHIFFLLTIAEPFERKGESDDLYTLWYNTKDALDGAKTVIAKTADLFKKKGVPVSKEELLSWSQEAFLGLSGVPLSREAFFSYIGCAKTIEKNPFGEYGLREFPEIHPRGMRDEAYIVLKRGGAPLHFRTVAQEVTKYRKKYTDERDSANPQTIHNELIKDNRFVLVGRGMYALKEWGYAPGVVRDVIVRVLGSAGKPLLKDEIVRLVREQRFVQDNTIFLNLHNKKYFKRTDEGHFTLRA